MWSPVSLTSASWQGAMPRGVPPVLPSVLGPVCSGSRTWQNTDISLHHPPQPGRCLSDPVDAGGDRLGHFRGRLISQVDGKRLGAYRRCLAGFQHPAYLAIPGGRHKGGPDESSTYTQYMSNSFFDVIHSFLCYVAIA